MDLIGTIVQLQIQRSSLKLGERPRRWFDPAPLLSVAALELEPGGVVGLTEQGERIVDVHNRRHPESRFGKDNGLSFGFTSHYERMRERLGEAMSNGIAGENVLVRTERAFDRADLPPELILETASGHVELTGARVAEPCVEFSRYALGYRGAPGQDLVAAALYDAAASADFAPNASGRPDPTVKETLIFLRRGMRGYYATYTRGATVLRVGDRLLIP